jgi:hypothetical protein
MAKMLNWPLKQLRCKIKKYTRLFQCPYLASQRSLCLIFIKPYGDYHMWKALSRECRTSCSISSKAQQLLLMERRELEQRHINWITPAAWRNLRDKESKYIKFSREGDNTSGRIWRLKWNIDTKFVPFEVLTAVTMKRALLWDVTPCSPALYMPLPPRRQKSSTSLFVAMYSYLTFLFFFSVILVSFFLSCLYPSSHSPSVIWQSKYIKLLPQTYNFEVMQYGSHRAF